MISGRRRYRPTCGSNGPSAIKRRASRARSTLPPWDRSRFFIRITRRAVGSTWNETPPAPASVSSLLVVALKASPHMNRLQGPSASVRRCQDLPVGVVEQLGKPAHVSCHVNTVICRSRAVGELRLDIRDLTRYARAPNTITTSILGFSRTLSRSTFPSPALVHAPRVNSAGSTLPRRPTSAFSFALTSKGLSHSYAHPPRSLPIPSRNHGNHIERSPRD